MGKTDRVTDHSDQTGEMVIQDLAISGTKIGVLGIRGPQTFKIAREIIGIKGMATSNTKAIRATGIKARVFKGNITTRGPITMGNTNMASNLEIRETRSTYPNTGEFW